MTSFPKEGLQFLRQLKKHNDREWFQARKDTYETQVKAPMLSLAIDINDMLATQAPDLVTDPKKAVYRIYRDTRFSKDKTPYKTHIGMLFWHSGLGKDSGAFLYTHVATDEVIIAGGMYMPQPPDLALVRQRIADKLADFEAIAQSKKVKALGGITGDELSRPPKGFDKDHPAMHWLRKKQFMLSQSLPAEAALEPNYSKTVTTSFQSMLPFVEFLNGALIDAAKKKSRDPLMSRNFDF